MTFDPHMINNKTGMSLFCNLIHKITRDLPRSLFSSFKHANNEM